MQITEQLIERIARRVFNSMFAPALRQSNVQGGGTPSSVRYADEAGHAASADSVAWTGVTGKPSFATVATSGSYNDLSNKPSIPSVSGNVSGSTMTITINGTAYSLTDTNTWRPVQNTLDSTATGDSLSAYQGYLLARGSARDNTKLPLSGGDMNSGARISFGGGNGYIGNANNAGWLMVQDICSQNGAGDTYWSLRTDGTAHFTEVISYGDVTAMADVTNLSDARHKQVIGNVVLSVEQIAKMPAVLYKWTDRDDDTIHVGTLAQNWQPVLPQVVKGKDTLSMNYSVAALVSSVVIARKAVDNESRIKELEKECQRLRTKLEQLRIA